MREAGAPTRKHLLRLAFKMAEAAVETSATYTSQLSPTFEPGRTPSYIQVFQSPYTHAITLDGPATRDVRTDELAGERIAPLRDVIR